MYKCILNSNNTSVRENRSEMNTVTLASKFKKSNVSQVRTHLDRLSNMPEVTLLGSRAGT